MKALILVDIQNDFTPTGALPVPEGDQVVPVVNKIMDKFELVVATQEASTGSQELCRSSQLRIPARSSCSTASPKSCGRSIAYRGRLAPSSSPD